MHLLLRSLATLLFFLSLSIVRWARIKQKSRPDRRYLRSRRGLRHAATGAPLLSLVPIHCQKNPPPPEPLLPPPMAYRGRGRGGRGGSKDRGGRRRSTEEAGASAAPEPRRRQRPRGPALAVRRRRGLPGGRLLQQGHPPHPRRAPGARHQQHRHSSTRLLTPTAPHRQQEICSPARGAPRVMPSPGAGGKVSPVPARAGGCSLCARARRIRVGPRLHHHWGPVCACATAATAKRGEPTRASGSPSPPSNKERGRPRPSP
jgi:hypothetical protein